MEIYYLFSRNEKIGSKLIAKASAILIKDLEKVPSHMAILIKARPESRGLVFESTFESGVRIVPYRNWKEMNEECYKIKRQDPLELDKVLDYVQSMWGKKYDWGGIAFFAISFIKHLLFKTKFPKTNLWQNEKKFFCNELCGKLADYPNYSMATPAKICSDFLKEEKYGKNDT